MRIGIVGPAERAVAWERHIRSQRVVGEVAIAPALRDIGDVDACFLLIQDKEQLRVLLDSIKMGYHSFLVSRLPRDTDQIQKIYHAAEESNVRLQFSHWPTLSPLYQWMKKRITHPDFAQIHREVAYSTFMEMDMGLDELWTDEVALCLKWINSSIHHVDAQTVNLGKTKEYAIHIFLRYENGATVSIWVNTTSDSSVHRRRVANANYLLDCNVDQRIIRMGRKGSGDHLFFEKKSFEDADPAPNAATQFLKAIQLDRPTPFNGHDALRTCKTIDLIQNKLDR